MAVTRFLSTHPGPPTAPVSGARWLGGLNVITSSKETAVAAVPLNAAVQRVSVADASDFSYRRVSMKAKPATPVDGRGVSCLRLNKLCK